MKPATTFSIIRRFAGVFFLAVSAFAFAARVTAAEETKPVSYYNEVLPVFKKSCTGCHHPGKLKGQLDMTTHAALVKGGKHGPAFKAGDPKASRLVEEIVGAEPSMPKEGDPLSKEEIALIERWIQQGGADDTPAGKLNPFKLAGEPVYTVPGVVSALAYSPDGSLLAVSGYHEVILHKSDGSGIVARLVGESPRIEAIVFSADGKLLGVAGGAPAVFGEVQIWDVSTRALVKATRVSGDSVYGICFSPDAKTVAVGGADKSARVINTADGKEVMKFDNHSDWVFGATYSVDGKRLLTGSRDRAMKLINVANGQFMDDVNKLLENILCIARNPKEDQAVYGGEQGTPRIYRMAENTGRTAANNDVNLVREFERQPGAIHAVSFNPDGTQIAVGSTGDEVRIYKVADGARAATLKGHEGAIFTLAYNPKAPQIATGGFDGKIRIYDTATGKLVKEFVPFPIKPSSQVAAAGK